MSAVRRLVDDLPVLDGIEAEHRDRAIAWLNSTADIFRRAKPATPDPHLVTYVVVVDPATGDVLLADHRLSGLWLPAGGHVDPGEHPTTSAARELGEELGPPAASLVGDGPRFLTWTPTRGPDSHVDVSLWYVAAADRSRPLEWDRREFHAVRWWSRTALLDRATEGFEPHLSRFLAKLDGST